MFGRYKNNLILAASFLALAPSVALGDVAKFSCQHSRLNTLSKEGYRLPEIKFPGSWDLSATEQLWQGSSAAEIKKIIAYHIAIFGTEDEASKLLLSGFPIKPLPKEITLEGSFLSKANNEKVEGLFAVSPQNGPEVFLSEDILKDSFVAITKLRHELWHYLLDREQHSEEAGSWYKSELREAKREVDTISRLRLFYLDHFGVTEVSKHSLDLLDFHLLAAMLRQSNYQLHLDAVAIVEQIEQLGSPAALAASKQYFSNFLAKKRISPTPEEHQQFKAMSIELLRTVKRGEFKDSTLLENIALQTAQHSEQALRRLVAFHNNALYWEGTEA